MELASARPSVLPPCHLSQMSWSLVSAAPRARMEMELSACLGRLLFTGTCESPFSGAPGHRLGGVGIPATVRFLPLALPKKKVGGGLNLSRVCKRNAS